MVFFLNKYHLDLIDLRREEALIRQKCWRCDSGYHEEKTKKWLNNLLEHDVGANVPFALHVPEEEEIDLISFCLHRTLDMKKTNTGLGWSTIYESRKGRTESPLKWHNISKGRNLSLCSWVICYHTPNYVLPLGASSSSPPVWSARLGTKWWFRHVFTFLFSCRGQRNSETMNCHPKSVYTDPEWSLGQIVGGGAVGDGWLYQSNTVSSFRFLYTYVLFAIYPEGASKESSSCESNMGSRVTKTSKLLKKWLARSKYLYSCKKPLNPKRSKYYHDLLLLNKCHFSRTLLLRVFLSISLLFVPFLLALPALLCN